MMFVDISESVKGDGGGGDGDVGCCRTVLGEEGKEVRGDDATVGVREGALQALVCAASFCDFGLVVQCSQTDRKR